MNHHIQAAAAILIVLGSALAASYSATAATTTDPNLDTAISLGIGTSPSVKTALTPLAVGGNAHRGGIDRGCVGGTDQANAACICDALNAAYRTDKAGFDYAVSHNVNPLITPETCLWKW